MDRLMTLIIGNDLAHLLHYSESPINSGKLTMFDGILRNLSSVI